MFATFKEIASITTGSTATFLILLLFEIHIIADYNSSFSSSFSFMQHLNLHDELISLHLLVFLSVTVISDLLVYLACTCTIFILFQISIPQTIFNEWLWIYYHFSSLYILSVIAWEVLRQYLPLFHLDRRIIDIMETRVFHIQLP